MLFWCDEGFQQFLSHVGNLCEGKKPFLALDVLHSVTLRIPPAVFRPKSVSFREK